MAITLDANRLSFPTQRLFNAAWHEMEGRAVQVLPQVGWELMQQMIRTDDIASGATRVHQDLRKKGNTWSATGRLRARIALWWAGQLGDGEGSYRVVTMTPEEHERADAICKNIDVRAFPRTQPEEVPQHSDTIIISQALVTGSTALLTGNMRSILHEDVNRWATENAARFGIENPEVLRVQDEVMPKLYAGAEARRELCKIALGAAWPEQEDAKLHEVEGELYEMLEAMPGARLENTGIVIHETWSTEDDPYGMIGEVGQRLPHRMRQAERRHPTYPRSKSLSRMTRGRPEL